MVVGGARVEGRFRVLLRERIEMVDPRDPGAKQPYHTVEDVAIEEAGRRLAECALSAGRMAGGGMGRIVANLAARGYRTVGIGILQSSGRKGSSLAATLASHALIHTADGDHFRQALAGAAAGLGLPVVEVPLRDLDALAAEGTGESIEDLHLALKEGGREVGPPWGADQKAAALMALVVLSSTV